MNEAYYHQDALGSVLALSDENGAVKTRYAYDPFGNTEMTGEESDQPFQYTGRENDGTGLYYYRSRYYSPELQRFISKNPIGFAMRTAYCSVIIIMLVSICARVYANDMNITKDAAIEIANKLVRLLGYDSELLNIKATIFNTPWNDYIPKDSTDTYYVERMNKLEGREYWAVYFYPNAAKVGKGYKGGDLCIFIDATSGNIITFTLWK